MLTGGGSGGPTTPLLGLVETLEEVDEISCEFLFLGTFRGPERSMVEDCGVSFHAIPAGKLRRYWDWQNLSDPFQVLAGFFAGIYYLLKFRPHVVMSAGSFASVPIAWASSMLRVPHLILQMDVRPGLANRLMKTFSDGETMRIKQAVQTLNDI